MKKLSKATYGFIFAIVALVILLGISLYLGLSGWFFSNINHISSDMQIGETVNVDLTQTGAQAVSFTFPGSLLPGQKLEQNINITNSAPTDLFVRAKAIIFDYDEGEIDIELGISEHWSKNLDYYYFDEALLKSNKISLASYLQLLPDKYYDSSKYYVLTIIVEAVDVKFDRENIWGY